ncbi:hypothetical protein H4Q26_013431 [Puccinia striiformis f. sp. tritici PST-130]|nr:hypothetical protein H4Q26_013431 [Puccinia striiformis f. sp. tritici PST-130]
MLPKNLLSFIALHPLTIIHTTLAMKIPDQPMDVREEINQNTLMAGTLEFSNGSDEEQCRQNKETIGLMNEDVEMIRRHIGYLEESKEPIHLEFLNQLEQIDSHLLKHIGAKIEDLGGEQNLISSVMHRGNPVNWVRRVHNQISEKVNIDQWKVVLLESKLIKRQGGLKKPKILHQVGHME